MKIADIICLVLLLRCQVQAFQKIYKTTSHYQQERCININGEADDCKQTSRKVRSLVLAAYDQDWDYVRLNNEHEFYMKAADSNDRSLAMMAAESGQWDMVHWLREKGVDINLQDNLQRSVLHIASSHRRWDDMRLLVTNGSNINAVDYLGRTATIMAASYQEWDIVQWLIEQGADLNSRDGYGRTILLLAASQNNWRFVKWLLSKGADPKIADQSRRTLLQLAAMADNLDVVQILVEEFHVDFNEEDRAGNTAINMAAINNNPTGTVYKYLVYKREMNTQISKYRRGNVEYEIRELTLMNRIKKMQDVISMGQDSLNIKMYGRVIMVLGNMKSGKSTLIKFLSESTSQLISQPVVEGSGLFKIVPINGTAIPPSVYPQLVHYKEKGVLFCDGPSFTDMGTISQDLTAVHFLKKVTEKFRRVKFVFTVSHLTIKRGMNSGEFKTFLQHSTSFITDFTLLSKSSCIVVTKFDQPRSGVRDSQLEKAAALTLSKAVESILEELDKKYLPIEKINFYKKAVDFLMVFLERNAWGNYERIRIFRRPKNSGSLNKIERMDHSKDRLSQFIFADLSYVKVKQSNFDYPLSYVTLKTIYKFGREANKEITSAMTSIADHVEDQLFSRARNSDDVFKTRHWFREACKGIEEIMKNIYDDDFRTILFSIRIALDGVKIYPRKISTYKIEHLGKFLKFLQKIVKNKIKTTPWEWRDPFRMLVMSIRQTRDWYDFLMFFYQNLITCKFQDKKRDLRLKWSAFMKTSYPGKFVTQNNVESFLEIMKNNDIRRIDAIEMRYFHDFEIDSVNKILQFAMMEETNMDQNPCIMTGHYVSLKSVQPFITKCQYLKLYATVKLFIDSDLVKINTVTIIAPTIEVIKTANIIMKHDGTLRIITKTLTNPSNLMISVGKYSEKPKSGNAGKVIVKDIGNITILLSKDLNDYLMFSIGHLKNPFVSSTLLKFLSDIDVSPEVSSHYSTSALLNDLIELEEKYYSMNEKIDFLPLYESLLKRTETYIKKTKSNENTDQYKLALTHLNTVVMSKVSSLKQERRDNLVLNIQEFFRLSLYIIEEIESKGNKIAATQFKEKFQADLQKQIEEGNAMIENTILPTINDILDSLNDTADELTVEVDKQIKELEKYLEELEEYREQLKRFFAIQTALGVFGFLGGLLSMCGPYGAAAGAMISVGVGIGSQLNKRPEYPPSTYKQAKAVTNAAQMTIGYALKDATEIVKKVKKFQEEMAAFSKILEKNEIRDLANNIITTFSSKDALKLTFNKGRASLKKFYGQCKTRIKFAFSKKGIKYGLSKLNVETVTNAVSVASAVTVAVLEGTTNILNTVEQSASELEELDKKIEEVKENINQLKEFKSKIQTEMIPMINDMKKDMEKAHDAMKQMTSLQLSMENWRLDSGLRDAQRQLSMMTEGYDKIHSDVNAQMDDLRAAIDVQVKIFQKLQDYMEQSKMVGNMHDLTNPDYFKQGYPPEIQKDVDKLDLMISSNLLLNHRARALGALKQWVFPFAHDYLKIFKIPKQLNYKRNLTEMVKLAKDELTKIHMTLMTDAAIPTKRDHCTLNYYFYQKMPDGPFYIWKNADNINFIISLLSGEEVTVNVDIRQKLNFNAVKFKYIKLSFQALNEEKQQELDKLLQKFQVKMTHLGNSHFHCDGKIYTMTSDSLEIRYSLVDYAPDEPATVSEVFKKLRKGDMMLSPYATWKIQLLDSANTGSLGKLLAFVDYIDVLLEGEGQYLNEDCLSQCSNNMDEYYIVDATA